MRRHLIVLAAAAGLGLPAGVVLAIVLTPVLWKLEPILHMELAGHSGPAGWVYVLAWAIATSVVFVLMRIVFLRRPTVPE